MSDPDYLIACDERIYNAAFWTWRDHDDRRYWYTSATSELKRYAEREALRMTGYSVDDGFGNLMRVPS